MVLMMQLAAVLAFFSTVGFAETWSGELVDSKCYAAEQRNVNPTDTETWVDSDKVYDIRYCSPRSKTRAFAVVDRDGRSFNLDLAGNSRAAELVPNDGKKHVTPVTVTGAMNGKAIQVDSISPGFQR
jgi:hypothetical protein